MHGIEDVVDHILMGVSETVPQQVVERTREKGESQDSVILEKLSLPAYSQHDPLALL